MHIIQSLEELASLKSTKSGLLVYFSHNSCNVCKVLKPKLEAEFTEFLPDIYLSYCDTIEYPEIAAQNNVFTGPTVIVYFNGSESFRYSRNMSLKLMFNEISRPYKMLFS